MMVLKIAAGAALGILGAAAVLYIVSAPVGGGKLTASPTEAWVTGYVATIQRPLADSATGEQLPAGVMLDAEVSPDGEQVRVIYRGERINVPAAAVVLAPRR